MRYFLFLVLAIAANNAAAQSSYSLIPANPRAGDPVALVINTSTGCYSGEYPQMTRTNPQIEIKITISDSLPCGPAQQTPVAFALGDFERGVYEVSVIECTNAPIPCSVKATLALTVLGISTDAATIPALSTAAMTLLALGAVMLGWRSWRVDG